MVGIAICPTNRRGRRLKLEPLQQGFVLRMVSSALRPDWNGRVGKAFNHVSDFQIILAISILRQPPRSDAVNSVAAHKRVVHALGDLVAERGHVLKSRAEQAGADPA